MVDLDAIRARVAPAIGPYASEDRRQRSIRDHAEQDITDLLAVVERQQVVIERSHALLLAWYGSPTASRRTHSISIYWTEMDELRDALTSMDTVIE